VEEAGDRIENETDRKRGKQRKEGQMHLQEINNPTSKVKPECICTTRKMNIYIYIPK